jgi:hypothetical protein
MSGINQPKDRTGIPLLIHVLNVAGLMALSSILLISSVFRLYQFVALVAVFVAAVVVYWRFRSNANLVAVYFALPVSVGFWILLCENVVAVDNLLGTQISTNLSVGFKLQSYIGDHLNSLPRRRFFQPCCNDSLTYNLKPGSRHRDTYDCDTCNESYDVTVDETGYLNEQAGLWNARDHIEIFVAGDSVLQGIGLPSVFESVRARTPLKIWNLSLRGYGPREKVNALLTYALPKRPRWLIVDFYSANDPTDCLDDEACEKFRDYRCKFSRPELRRRQLLEHPIYSELVNPEPNQFAVFDYYAENSLTLAVTRHVTDRMKSQLKQGFSREPYQNDDSGPEERAFDMAHPGQTTVPVRPGRLGDWVKAGVELSHKDYERLAAGIAQSEHKPSVILLYNPSAYEIYRDILAKPNALYDELGAFQLSAQRDFARRHAWTFLDLTEPLRSKLKSSKAWIYGRHDGAHWSRAGSLIVADVLATELLRVIGPATPPKRATKTYINRQPALNSSCLRRSRSQPAALSSNCN